MAVPVRTLPQQGHGDQAERLETQHLNLKIIRLHSTVIANYLADVFGDILF